MAAQIVLLQCLAASSACSNTDTLQLFWTALTVLCCTPLQLKRVLIHYSSKLLTVSGVILWPLLCLTYFMCYIFRYTEVASLEGFHQISKVHCMAPQGLVFRIIPKTGELCFQFSGVASYKIFCSEMDIKISKQWNQWNSAKLCVVLTHWHTQPAVRRSEPSMSFAFNSSLLSVDGMTCLLPFESW